MIARGTPAEVLALHRQQVNNFFCLLMLSNGTPMFCAGDEFLNTARCWDELCSRTAIRGRV